MVREYADLIRREKCSMVDFQIIENLNYNTNEQPTII